MTTKKKVKQPNWKKWGEAKFLPWHLRNENKGIEPPAGRTEEMWQRWGIEVYIPWYNQPVASSNPTDPPPPPPGPIKP